VTNAWDQLQAHVVGVILVATHLVGANHAVVRTEQKQRRRP
jgi:hypothetical protein